MSKNFFSFVSHTSQNQKGMDVGYFLDQQRFRHQVCRLRFSAKIA